MTHPSNLSVVNLEFLRKEAKSILKRCRSLDPSTLHRIRGAIPRIASFDDRRAGVEVAERVPLKAGAGAHNRAYLDTKRDRSGHQL